MTKIMTFMKRASNFQAKEERFIQKIGLISIGVSIIIIMLIMSLFVMYTKYNRQKAMVSDGLNLSSMVAGYSVKAMKKEDAYKLLQIVNYSGNRSGLIYSIINDTNQKVIAYTGSRYVDRPLISKRAASSNNPLKQVFKDDRTNNTIYEFSRPLYVDGQKEAIVRLGFSPESKPLFSDSEIRGLLLVATLFFSLVPIFYYLVRGAMRLHTISMTDQLTGIYNRRGFFSLAEDCLMLAKRTDKVIMLLYADLDNLKDVNDTLGHQAGDRLIKETADILKSTYRTSDVIARMGGDEFVVFATGMDEEHVSIITNRLQKKIDKYNSKKNNRYELRVSTGIVIYDANTVQSIDELLAEADELMYKQKKNRKTGLAGNGLYPDSVTSPGGTS